MKISFFTSAFFAITAILLTSVIYAEDNIVAISSVTAPNPMNKKPWETRRLQFAKIVQGVRSGDPQANKDFEMVLTEFDT